MQPQTLNPTIPLRTSVKTSAALDFIKSLLQTNGNATPLILRLALAITLFPHGAQKALGWFGGYGFSATLNAFQQYMHIPFLLALAVILTEFLGSIALAFGFMTRASALLAGITMVVAALKVHLANGFFMNWAGTQKGEGVEYFIPVLALVFALVLNGGGRGSVDRILFHKLEQAKN